MGWFNHQPVIGWWQYNWVTFYPPQAGLAHLDCSYLDHPDWNSSNSTLPIQHNQNPMFTPFWERFPLWWFFSDELKPPSRKVVLSEILENMFFPNSFFFFQIGRDQIFQLGGSCRNPTQPKLNSTQLCRFNPIGCMFGTLPLIDLK